MTRTDCPECGGACLVPCASDEESLLCTRLSGEKLCGTCGGLGTVEQLPKTRGVPAAVSVSVASGPRVLPRGSGAALEAAHADA